jgi:hypothetical protein
MSKQIRKCRKGRKSRLETLRQEKVGLEQKKRKEKRRKKMRQQRKEGEDNRKRKQVTILRPLQSEKLHNNRSRPDNWHLKGLLIPWSQILFPHLNIKYNVHGSQQITVIYTFM